MFERFCFFFKFCLFIYNKYLPIYIYCTFCTAKTPNWCCLCSWTTRIRVCCGSLTLGQFTWVLMIALTVICYTFVHITFNSVLLTSAFILSTVVYYVTCQWSNVVRTFNNVYDNILMCYGQRRETRKHRTSPPNTTVIIKYGRAKRTVSREK